MNLASSLCVHAIRLPMFVAIISKNGCQVIIYSILVLIFPIISQSKPTSDRIPVEPLVTSYLFLFPGPSSSGSRPLRVPGLIE